MLDQTALVNQVRELILPLLTNRNFELVELTCHSGGGRLLLRCLADTATGITVEELSFLNRSIGAMLDEHDLVPERYLLEVSSPGLDRPLKAWTDFDRVVGRRVRVTTAQPIASRQEHTGQLLSASEEAIVLRTDSGDKLPIRLAEIVRAVQEVQIR